MDRAVVILLIVLLIIFGIFFISLTMSGNSAKTEYTSYQGQQYVGGGCGR